MLLKMYLVDCVYHDTNITIHSTLLTHSHNCVFVYSIIDTVQYIGTLHTPVHVLWLTILRADLPYMVM